MFMPSRASDLETLLLNPLVCLPLRNILRFYLVSRWDTAEQTMAAPPQEESKLSPQNKVQNIRFSLLRNEEEGRKEGKRLAFYYTKKKAFGPGRKI